MGQFTDKVINELKEIKDKQSEHSAILAVNTEIVRQHERRSTNLEARMQPIEEHVRFINKAVKVLCALVALGAGISTIFHYLK